MRARQIKIDKADSVLATIDSLNGVAIFSSMLAETGRLFLAHIGRYFWTPAGAIITITRTIIAWHRFYREKHKANAFRQLIVETIAATIITLVSLGGLFVTTLLSVSVPEIVIFVMASKLLYHFALIFHYRIRAHYLEKEMNDEALDSLIATNTPQKKHKSKREINECNHLLKENVIAFVSGICAVVAISFVAIFAKPIMAIFGIAAGIINTVVALIDCVKLFWPKKRPTKQIDSQPISDDKNSQELEMSPLTSPTQNAKLHSTITSSLSCPNLSESKRESGTDKITQVVPDANQQQAAQQFSESKSQFSCYLWKDCQEKNREQKTSIANLQQKSSQIIFNS